MAKENTGQPQWEAPAVVEISALPDAFGADCTLGTSAAPGNCNTGNNASPVCGVGNLATPNCNTGNGVV
jgi:hypothetical protein